MKGDAKVIEYLNAALRSELTAVSQYWLHYRLQEDWGYGRIADKSRAESIEEMHHADRLMISSTKAMHGHIIGGTGAVELLACIMALRDGVIAPTIGYQEADPECGLDVVPNEAREARVDAVLSNAFAFGGLNAVIALRRL